MRHWSLDANWSDAPHLDLDGLLGSAAKRKQFLNELKIHECFERNVA
ncbi:hypothetical protein [Peribacillus sp. FSL E2-0159]